MLLTTLLLLATRTDTVKGTMDRFRAFVKSHPQLSVDVKISVPSSGGSGELLLVRSNRQDGTKVDWHSVIAGHAYDFIASGPLALEVDNGAKQYDRHPTHGYYEPGGRIILGPGFPTALTMLALPFDHNANSTKLILKGADVELAVTIQTQRGPVDYTADFGPDGRLNLYKVAAGSRFQTDVFQNYRFDSVHSATGFSVAPPLGYSPLVFDDLLSTLKYGTALPVPGIPAAGKVFVAFVDDLIPDGMAETLTHINATIPVVVVSLQPANPQLKKFKFIRASEATFDKAGVQMTPQFYLVDAGKAVQAWQGFRSATAAKLEQEVLTFQADQ